MGGEGGMALKGKLRGKMEFIIGLTKKQRGVILALRVEMWRTQAGGEKCDQMEVE